MGGERELKSGVALVPVFAGNYTIETITVLKLTIFNGTVQNSDAALLAINGQRDRY